MVMSTHKRAVMISFMCKILKHEICKRQGVKGWLPGDGGDGEWTIRGMEFSFGSNENVLELDDN